jgi:predicted dehydrogenase
MKPAILGIIGCGTISDAYLLGAARSGLVRVKACADLRPEAAAAKAQQYGIAAVPVAALLSDPEIEIVVNLTVPQAHAPLDLEIIAAGKHVYSEKPLATDLTEARAVTCAAAAAKVRIGCAPDTFLGAAHQACRRAIDAGRIGRPIGGAAAVLSHGMEHWHPDPTWFYQSGGGPMLDMGPYYVTQLVNLLGPVAQVTGHVSIGNPTRTIMSAPQHGRGIEVTVPTTINGVLAFADGANVVISASWDVWRHCRRPLEIYGTEGSLAVPDPNWFGGTPMINAREADWTELDTTMHPFGVANRTVRSAAQVADYRIIGVIDLAAAIQQGRPHRADGALALHVLEILDAFGRSSRSGHHIAIESACARPAPLPMGTGEEVFLS